MKFTPSKKFLVVEKFQQPSVEVKSDVLESSAVFSDFALRQSGDRQSTTVLWKVVSQAECDTDRYDDILLVANNVMPYNIGGEEIHICNIGSIVGTVKNE